jgi:peroxiredoxin
MEKNDISVERLAKMAVKNQENEAIQLGTLWQDKTAVLVFVRHLGWIFCRQQVAELVEHNTEFKEENAELVVISTSEPKYIEEFQQITGFQGKILSDPQATSFKALGFSDSISGLISPKAMFKGLSAMSKGHKQGRVQGSTLQLGGAIVVDPSLNIPYYFAGKTAGDHPAISELLSAVQKGTK